MPVESDISRMQWKLPRRWRLVVVAISLALASCARIGMTPSYPPPPGWTDITPPDSGQVAVYAVSSDVPGLILADIGSRSDMSVSPPGAASLWRSTDGGATWTTLNSISPDAGTALAMPSGGHGLVFAQGLLRSDSLYVSDNAGTTWRILHQITPAAPVIKYEIDWLSGAVVVGSRLYAAGVAPGWGGLAAGTSRFSVSEDGGHVWRPVESQPDPAGAQARTLSIAPLDATGLTWLRISAVESAYSDMGANSPPRVIYERSHDGGLTWTVVSTAPADTTVLRNAQLATNPHHPKTICATFTTTVVGPGAGSAFNGGAARAAPGEPPPPPLDIALYASSDSGATWRGGVVARIRRAYGNAVAPGVSMSADGSCYLATSVTDSLTGRPASVRGTLWRLAPGESTPKQVFSMTDRGLLNLFLAPRASGSAGEIVALARISGPGDGDPMACGHGCQTTRDGGVYRLITMPAPTP